jgi:hypothetical protein
VTGQAAGPDEAWLYRNPHLSLIAVAVLAALASLFGVGIGIGNTDLDAGGRFGLVLLYLPAVLVVSASVVGAAFAGTLMFAHKRGVRAGRGLARALVVAGLTEVLPFGLIVAITHNYAAAG